ncbi:MAG: DNA-binding protein, partial [Sulfuricurvum sp.]
TDALNEYLNMGTYKYGVYTNKIYEVIFLENATEYKKILDLKDKDKVRETMYAEVLNAIASFEHGLAVEMKQEHDRLRRKLTASELDNLITKAAESPYLTPHINDARVKMASRDLCFRDVLHHKLESHIQSVPQGDFDKFLGETSKSLEERLSDPETLAVLKRLKDR